MGEIDVSAVERADPIPAADFPGRARVEGVDQRGWFLLEATSGIFIEGGGQQNIKPSSCSGPGVCRWAA